MRYLINITLLFNDFKIENYLIEGGVICDSVLFWLQIAYKYMVISLDENCTISEN